MKLRGILFLIALIYASQLLFAQENFDKLRTVTIVDSKPTKLYDSAQIFLNKGKIETLHVFKREPLHESYSYNDQDLLSEVKKNGNLYHLRYDDEGRIVSLKEHNYKNGKTTTHVYEYDQDRVVETTTGGNFPYTTVFFIEGKEITKSLTTRPDNMPPPMRDEVTYEMAYEKGNLVKVQKIKENKFTKAYNREYILEFEYDDNSSIFAKLNEVFFGKHAKTTSLLLNSASFYNNIWDPYFVGFDMAGNNNIVSMKTESKPYLPYVASYEYNEDGSLKQIVKTIDYHGMDVIETIVFKYK